jgi:hypothetical protein
MPSTAVFFTQLLLLILTKIMIVYFVKEKNRASQSLNALPNTTVRHYPIPKTRLSVITLTHSINAGAIILKQVNKNNFQESLFGC